MNGEKVGLAQTAFLPESHHTRPALNALARDWFWMGCSI